MPGVIGVAGLGAAQIDFLHAVYGNFPLMLAIIALLTFVLLVRAFRSLLLPLKAVLLNLISLAATLGVDGAVLAGRPRLAGDLRHPGHRRDHLLDPADGLRVPVRAVDGLRGVHPGPDAGGVRRRRRSTDDAVIEGIGRTGRLVTCAALILFLAFAALASGPGTDLKMLATGARHRHPARRHDRPVAAGAGAGLAVRSLELVALPSKVAQSFRVQPSIR